MVAQRIFYIITKVLVYLNLFTFMSAASARVLHKLTSSSHFPHEASIPFETSNPEGQSTDDAELYHTFSFYMHNIQGGQTPSAKAINGIVNSRIPFVKPNSIFVNNNIPFLTLNSETGPQIYAISTLQKLVFGTITVFDNELTDSNELESETVGKAQGFYVASSEDGRCLVIAFTAMFESGGYVDSLSFFGVRRTGVSESHLAIMGGTGIYVAAKGFTIVKMPLLADHDSTDGVETLLEFVVHVVR